MLQTLGTKMDLDDIVILQFSGLEHYEPVLRITQYLERGEYAPFHPESDLTIVDRTSGTVIPYQPKTAYANPENQTSPNTHRLFNYEVDLYKVAMHGEFTALQEKSSRRIRHEYPVYAAETAVMLQRLYGRAEDRIVIARTDPKMAAFVSDGLSKFHAGLAGSTDGTLDLLRQIVGPKRQIQAIVNAANEETVQDLLATLRKTTQPEQEFRLLAESISGNANVHRRSTTVRETPTAPSRPSASTSGSSKDPAMDHSSIIFNAIKDSRLLLATKSGFGTLRRNLDYRPDEQRNKDFEFVSGEVLLSHPGAWSINGANVKVVSNAKGQIGEVFRGLGFLVVGHGELADGILPLLCNMLGRPMLIPTNDIAGGRLFYEPNRDGPSTSPVASSLLGSRKRSRDEDYISKREP